MGKKTVLLTGATGFLGSHLLKVLIKNRFKPIILKRSFSDTWRIKDLLGNLVFYDIDKSDLNEIFRNNKIDIVIHTATLYGRKKERISDIADTNLMLPLRLLELSIEFGGMAFINTDTFFRTDTSLPDNLNYYVLSKKQFLEYAKGICEENNFRFVNFQLAHVYGPEDNPGKFIPYVIKKMLKSEKIDLTKGEQKRDFIYVEDVANAYLCVMNNLGMIKEKYSAFEIGSGVSASIKEIVLLIKSLCESDSELEFGALPYRENEIMDVKTDISCLRKVGWNVSHNLEEGLNKTIGYYRLRK